MLNVEVSSSVRANTGAMFECSDPDALRVR